ncbi:CASP9 protein, partial [Odontophorus gujanensis]|nr:CASP9 protein [Odontophorus gujanensis]
MEEERRRALRRGRVRLVEGLRPDALWGPLQARGVFTSAMVEDMQSAGTRREQARQLVIDLETRGKQAFPIFLSILRDTGHDDLADMLDEGCGSPESPPVDLRPVQLELPGGGRDKSKHSLSCAWQVYQLRADPCGHCLIINNVSFSRDSDLSPRAGSDIDCEKLEKRFKSLCFHVRTLRNLKAQEIDLELRKLARLDHSALDCCLVVILSHGCQTSHIQFPGGIYGTDGKTIPIEKIVNYFNGSQCPSLRGKPKLFFIQACGGERKDKGFEVDCESPQDETCRGSVESDAIPFQAPLGNADEPDAVASLPTPGDILVSYSTFPGFVSWRDKVSGSWYVETLDSVLEHYARSEDLLTMLVRVSDIVSTKGKYKQIPGCFNFLRKKFFFRCK